MKTFYIFWSSPPKLWAKSVLKEDNIEFPQIFFVFTPKIVGKIRTKGRQHWIPPKVFVPLEAHCSSAGPVKTLLYLQCASNTDSQQIILFCPTKCQHFVEILRKTLFAILKFIGIYRTVIITFLLKRYCSKSVLLKSALSLQIGSLPDHITRWILVQKKLEHKRLNSPTYTSNDKTSQR